MKTIDDLLGQEVNKWHITGVALIAFLVAFGIYGRETDNYHESDSVCSEHSYEDPTDPSLCLCEDGYHPNLIGDGCVPSCEDGFEFNYTQNKCIPEFSEKLIEETPTPTPIQAPQPSYVPPEAPAQPKTSNIEMQIKCEERGKEEFTDKWFDDGYIIFKFYYSPNLDTCLVEREESGPGPTDVVYKMYDMFSPNRSSHLLRYSLACFDQEDTSDCVTLGEYNREKAKLIGR